MAKSIKLTDAVKGYLLSRRSNCNEKTIGWYRQKLAHLCFVLEEEHEVTKLADVTTTHLRLFIEHMKETKADENNPHKPTRDEMTIRDVTVKGYAQAIKGFFNWCVSEEPPLIKRNPATQLDNPKVARYVIKTFTQEHIDTLLAACDIHAAIGFRNRAIILLLLDTGIRVSEMTDLTLDRVYLSVLNEAFIKVMGKGRKEREVGLSAKTAETLWKYIHHYRDPKDSTCQALFIGASGKPLGVCGCELMLGKMARRVGIKGVRTSPHTFRHTFARMFLENGGDVYKLSLLLGHSSVTVTENYLKDFESRVARQGQTKYSPVANMDIGKVKRGFSKGPSDILGD